MTARHRATAAVVLALALLGSSAGAAAADDDVTPYSLSQCTTSAFCVWSAAAYQGSIVKTTSTSPVSVPFDWVSSVWNRSSFAARVYSGAGGTGSSVCYAPGAQVASVHVAAGSIRVLTTTSC